MAGGSLVLDLSHVSACSVGGMGGCGGGSLSLWFGVSCRMMCFQIPLHRGATTAGHVTGISNAGRRHTGSSLLSLPTWTLGRGVFSGSGERPECHALHECSLGSLSALFLFFCCFLPPPPPPPLLSPTSHTACLSMAWPCISRVCCLARFWNQLDKSDLSVPLTIQNYSEIADQEVRSVTKQVPTLDADLRGSPRAQVDGPGTRGSSRARKEPSYKPREDYHPPEVPFPSVTQYKQDFKPWPIPRKENFPWISNGGGGRADSVPDGSQNRAQAGEERARLGQRWGGQEVAEERRTSSYR